MANVFHIDKPETGLKLIFTEYKEQPEIGMFRVYANILLNDGIPVPEKVAIMQEYLDGFYAKGLVPHARLLETQLH